MYKINCNKNFYENRIYWFRKIIGLPVALAVESKGHEVYGYDINKKINLIIKNKKLPYKEKGANKLLEKSKIKTKDIPYIVKNSDIIFISIQTPHERKSLRV